MDKTEKTTDRHNRRLIASRVREVRTSRGWTQEELAAKLGISQGHLSKLERGEGSFTAEQFIEILRLFNVPATAFVRRAADGHLEEIQNALAYHGASHLWESDEHVPLDRLGEAAHAIQSALLEGDSRLVTAVAPVLVRNADIINLQKLALELAQAGLQRRLWWVVDSTLAAIEEELSTPQPRGKANLYRRAKLVLGRYLDAARDGYDPKSHPIQDILDPITRTKASVARLIANSSPVARRWGVVTSIEPRDFVLALRASHVGD